MHCAPFFQSIAHLNLVLIFQGQITLGVGILRDVMMMRSDANRDGKLSASEIESFYRQFYPTYVARMYGQEFIRIADTDHDGLLDQHGEHCLRMSYSSKIRLVLL